MTLTQEILEDDAKFRAWVDDQILDAVKKQMAEEDREFEEWLLYGSSRTACP